VPVESLSAMAILREPQTLLEVMNHGFFTGDILNPLGARGPKPGMLSSFSEQVQYGF